MAENEKMEVEIVEKESVFKKIKEKVSNKETWQKVGKTAAKIGTHVAAFAAGVLVARKFDCPEGEELDWDPDACDLTDDSSRTEIDI